MNTGLIFSRKNFKNKYVHSYSYLEYNKRCWRYCFTMYWGGLFMPVYLYFPKRVAIRTAINVAIQVYTKGRNDFKIKKVSGRWCWDKEANQCWY